MDPRLPLFPLELTDWLKAQFQSSAGKWIQFNKNLLHKRPDLVRKYTLTGGRSNEMFLFCLEWVKTSNPQLLPTHSEREEIASRTSRACRLLRWACRFQIYMPNGHIKNGNKYNEPMKGAFSFMGPRMWNSLPQEIRMLVEQSKNIFRGDRLNLEGGK